MPHTNLEMLLYNGYSFDIHVVRATRPFFVVVFSEGFLFTYCVCKCMENNASKRKKRNKSQFLRSVNSFT